MKSTDELIKELSHSHTAVSRDFSPLTRSALTLYLLSAIFGYLLYIVRPFSFTIRNTAHGIELLGIFLCINALTYYGFKSFIPGEPRRVSFNFLIISFGVLLLSLLNRLFMEQTFNVIRPYCEVEAMAVSMITTIQAHLLLRKNEFALRTTLSKVIFISIPMTALLYLHGVCSLEFQHVFTCHFLASLMIPSIYLVFKT